MTVRHPDTIVSSCLSPPPAPTNLIPRFSPFIEAMKRGWASACSSAARAGDAAGRSCCGAISRPRWGGSPRCTPASPPASCPAHRARACPPTARPLTVRREAPAAGHSARACVPAVRHGALRAARVARRSRDAGVPRRRAGGWAAVALLVAEALHRAAARDAARAAEAAPAEAPSRPWRVRRAPRVPPAAPPMGADALLSRLGRTAAANRPVPPRGPHRQPPAGRAPAGLGASGPAGPTNKLATPLAGAAVSTLRVGRLGTP